MSKRTPTYPVVQCLDSPQDINTHTATVKSLDFHTDFELVPTPSSSGSAVQIRAFITWFDTFFSHDSSPSGQAPSPQECSTEFFSDDAYERSIESVNSDKADVSFTTGPRGKPTHWKQVVFMLKQPVSLEQGKSDRFRCLHSMREERWLMCHRLQDNESRALSIVSRVMTTKGRWMSKFIGK